MGAVAVGAACVALGQQATVAPGPNKVAFPENWSKGVMYATVDRPDLKQYREFYTTPDVIAAAKAGRPAPDGAVIALAAYMAQLDAAGTPIKDANGRYMKGNLAAVNVMQKKSGWGEEIPAPIRNGDWVYQSFTPDGKANDKANLTSCYQCHLPFAREDFLTNLAKLKGSFPSDAKAMVKSGPDRGRHRRLRVRPRSAEGRRRRKGHMDQRRRYAASDRAGRRRCTAQRADTQGPKRVDAIRRRRQRRLYLRIAPVDERHDRRSPRSSVVAARGSPRAVSQVTG
jgi:hypothetical protein